PARQLLRRIPNYPTCLLACLRSVLRPPFSIPIKTCDKSAPFQIISYVTILLLVFSCLALPCLALRST
ncbi:hypothetical protein BDV95DRAFT_531633, partial [Massariosphaeria phaeospora]